jgi:hypothetical protein
MSGDIEALLGALRQWDGQDVFDVKVVLEKLLVADPDDARGWEAKAREILDGFNRDEWPDDGKPPPADWWAIDTALRRLYRLPGQKIFATGYYTGQRKHHKA